MRLAAVACLIAAPAMAQEPVCGPRDRMAAALASDYGESPVGAGVGTGGGYVAEVYADAGDGSWTIVIVGADGRACIVSEGMGWTAAARGTAL